LSEPEGLDEFLNAYITAALWSTNDESDDNGGEPLDKNYGEDDIAPVTLALMRADCAAFLYHKLGGRLLGIAERPEFEVNLSLPGGVGCSVMAYAGHALWLTRNGHGAGFWDGGRRASPRALTSSLTTSGRSTCTSATTGWSTHAEVEGAARPPSS